MLIVITIGRKRWYLVAAVAAKVISSWCFREGICVREGELFRVRVIMQNLVFVRDCRLDFLFEVWRKQNENCIQHFRYVSVASENAFSVGWVLTNHCSSWRILTVAVIPSCLMIARAVPPFMDFAIASLPWRNSSSSPCSMSLSKRERNQFPVFDHAWPNVHMKGKNDGKIQCSISNIQPTSETRCKIEKGFR